MKNLHTLGSHALCFATAIGISWNAYAAKLENAIDFTKVNATLKSALEDFSSKSDAIDTFVYSFDAEQTNVDQDKYQLDFKLVLPQTPWGKQLDAAGKISMQTNLADAKEKGLTFGVDGVYQTDALAMLKYKVTKISKCDEKKEIQGVYGILVNRHCEYVAKLSEITTVNQLHDMLVEKIAAHKADVTAYIASLDKGLTSDQSLADNVVVSTLISAEKTKAEKVLKFLDGIVLQQTKTGFSIEMPANDDCPILGLNGFKLEVSNDKVHAVGSIHLKFGKKLYQAAKPVFIEFLHGLENGEEFAIKHVQMDAEVLANLIANMLNEEPAGLVAQQAQQ